MCSVFSPWEHGHPVNKLFLFLNINSISTYDMSVGICLSKTMSSSRPSLIDMCIWVSQGRFFWHYNWMQNKLWGLALVLLYVINHLLLCIWITLLQRRRLLQAHQGTGWGKGRTEPRRKACEQPWAQGLSSPGLEGAQVENVGLIKPKTHKESAQGQKLTPRSKPLLASAPLFLLHLCSEQPRSIQTSPLPQTGCLEIFCILKALGVMGGKQPSILGNRLLTWEMAFLGEVAHGSHSKGVLGFPGETWGSLWETTHSVPLRPPHCATAHAVGGCFCGTKS